jgi:hypothetical protein
MTKYEQNGRYICEIDFLYLWDMRSPGSQSLKKVLAKVGDSARKKAFRQNRPVAISVDGESFLLYPSGIRKKITPQILRGLTNGKF